MLNDTQDNIANMKIALYARVSTDTQTVDNQTLRLHEFAKTKGCEFDLFEEVMTTRKTRPVKQELLARLRAGVYSAVVVYKLDRWARSSKELITEIKELLDKGVQFISISDNLDFSTASGKLHFQILCAFAEFERELIRERTIEGLWRAKNQGKLLGRPKDSKDTKKRKSGGYLLREASKRKKQDVDKGIYRQINDYLPDTVESK